MIRITFAVIVCLTICYLTMGYPGLIGGVLGCILTPIILHKEEHSWKRKREKLRKIDKEYRR